MANQTSRRFLRRQAVATGCSLWRFIPKGIQLRQIRLQAFNDSETFKITRRANKILGWLINYTIGRSFVSILSISGGKIQVRIEVVSVFVFWPFGEK